MSKYPTIIEQDTNYSFTIKESANLSFNKIREYSSLFYKMLPTNLQEKLYNDILHGACELDSEPKLNAYMFALGKMHNAKLQRAYDNLSADFCSERSIDIIDYACGQGMGTICYADYLKRSSSNQKVRRIILIEPSNLALARAALHVTHLFPDAEVITINKGFDDLTSEDLYAERETPTLHIISNVLDMGTTWEHEGFFDLQNFAELITQTVDGKNEFVCIEPLFGYKPKDEKVDLFMNYANIDSYYSLNKSKGEFVSGESWSCVIRVGKVYKNVDDGVEYDGILVSLYPEKISGEYIIKDGTTVIGDYAFSGCTGLTSVTIPESVTEIGDGSSYGGRCPFSGCTGLTKIEVSENNQNYCSKDGVLFSKDMRFLIKCPEGKKGTYTIPEGVTEIECGAFYECTGLTKITIPESVRSIESHAFKDTALYKNNDNWNNGVLYIDNCLIEANPDVIPSEYTIREGTRVIANFAFDGCSGLTSITIPESVTEIASNTFIRCSGLTSIMIPEGVTEIGYAAFEACSGLTNITIPNGVTEIASFAFSGCSGLTSVTIPESVRSIGWQAFTDTALYENKDNWNNGVLYIDNCLIKADPDVVPSEYSIRQGTRVIASYAFFRCSGLTSMTIPNGVTEIANYAFSGCSGLTSVTIPNGVTEIASFAFSDCSGLTSVTIPNGVTEIASFAFSDCSGLTSVTIPESVTEIAYFAFTGTALYKNKDNWNNGVLYINNCLIKANPDVVPSEYTIREGTRVIAGAAFEYCENLTSITIPESVTKIGHDAFRGCKNLTSITLPKSLLTQIGDEIFSDCNSHTITKTKKSSEPNPNDDLPFDLF